MQSSPATLFIENSTKSLAEIVFRRQAYRHEKLDTPEEIKDEDFLSFRLKRMLLQGDIQKSMELLYNIVREAPSYGNLLAAYEYYNELQKIDAMHLQASHITYEDIAQNMDKVLAIYQV